MSGYRSIWFGWKNIGASSDVTLEDLIKRIALSRNTELLLEMLESHLYKLVTIAQTDPLYHEYIEILWAFGLPIHQLFTYDEKVDKWPGVFHKRDTFRNTFNELVLVVEKMSRRLQV